MGSNIRPRYIQFRDMHDRDISGVHCSKFLRFLQGFFNRGQLWPSGIVVACVCVLVCHSLACLSNISGPFYARISGCGPKMQTTLIKVPFKLG